MEKLVGRKLKELRLSGLKVAFSFSLLLFSSSFLFPFFFSFFFFFLSTPAFSELVFFLDGSRGISDGSGLNEYQRCVSPGGIIISDEEISHLSFDFDGRRFYVFPVPATADGFFMGVKVCPENFPEENIAIRRRKRFESKDILEKIRKEKSILQEVYSRVSEKMWTGNFILPVRDYKRVIWNFGARRIINGYTSGFHKGIDISAPRGVPVFASNSGVVVIAKKFTLEGNLVVIDHGSGIFSIYAHLHKIKVSEGQKVKKGQIIGTVGSSGRATGPHLHFGIKVGKVDVNPQSLFVIEDVISNIRTYGTKIN